MIPKVIAHRGARRNAPENTMEAFELALQAGAHGIEFDVHRCSTGEIVVIHDEQVNRTTNGVGYIRDITWDELQRLDAGSWFDQSDIANPNQKFKGAKIPSLKQVLERVNGSAILNIEVKNAPVEYPGIEEDILDLLQDYPKETIIISSFDHQLMKRFAELDPSLSLALLASCIFIDVAAYAKSMNAKYWHPCFSEMRTISLEEAHRGGLVVNAWTLNSPRDWAAAIQMKLDGIVTDDPKGLIELLSRLEASSEAAAGAR